MKHKVRHIHFVGIGGVGMCGIAEVLHGLGFIISGSDMAESSATKHLVDLGVRVFLGHDATYIHGADVVVTSTAVRTDNPEVIAAKAHDIPIVPRALMLAELMRFKHGIAIAGTHGKTTTTSLTASVLAAAGLDPTFVIGGKLTAAGTNAQLGQGDFLVAEADESDASFLHLSPIMAVVTNIDEDHMGTYEHSLDKLKSAFEAFLQHLPFYGRAVLCMDDANVRAIRDKITKPITTYGFDEHCDIYAENVKPAGHKMQFDVVVKNGTIQRYPILLNMPGRHNVLNALAAIAIGLECGASMPAIQKGLLEFAGVGRRFQSYGTLPCPSEGRFTVIDDYGHHPVEMAATLAAVRGAFPGQRLVLAFQPHRYSRTHDLFSEFVRILSDVDVLLLGEVYAAGEPVQEDANGQALAYAIQNTGRVRPIFVEKINDMPTQILKVVKDGDVVVTMGAGSIGHVPAKIQVLVQNHATCVA